jgi:UDP-2-acetamido-3-amino-2,3-dideoxy-glucuronate N-acetyltransferase
MKKFFLHETAIVDEGAAIGDGTKIWHWVHVCGKASIGSNCILGQNVYIGNDVAIGNNVKIQNNVSVYDRVVLEDDVFCGPSMVFTNVINPRSAIPRKEEYLSTRIKRGATLGANCTIVCGVTVGAYAFVGAGSVVTKDVPAYALVMGNPARRTAWMGEFGVKLEKLDHNRWRCPAADRLYIETNGLLEPLST